MKHQSSAPRGSPCQGNGKAIRAIIAEYSTATPVGTMGPDCPPHCSQNIIGKGAKAGVDVN